MKRLITLSAMVAFLFGTTLSAYGDDDDKGKGKGKRGAGDPEAMFKRLDANGDGKVTKEEFAKMRENLPEKIKEKTKGKGNGQLGDKLFDLMDTNKDGSLSLEEFKKFRERVAERMKKGKGTK